jgi:ferric-dicitrate binding protein FerR (iron transport regulator)
MESLQSLLEKYWAGTLTAEERSILIDLLETQQEAVQSRPDPQFEPAGSANEPLLSDSRSQAVLQSLHEKISAPQTPVRRLPKNTGRTTISIAASAAAAVLIAVCCLYLLPRKSSPTVSTNPSPVLASTIKTILNHNDTIKRIVTEDGSIIELYPGSTLQYNEPFLPSERSFVLDGKALFSVAKDRARPFSVHSGNIVTIALGTRFWVDTRHPGGDTRVRLLEGKVMIRGAGAKNVFLDPGQECMIKNDRSSTPLVRNWSTRPGRTEIATIKKHNSDINTLEFTHMKLSEVFKRIGQHYKVTVRCEDASVNRLTFTGKFLPTDNMEVVLNVICNTNDLLFQQQDSLIVIRKLN